jgi:hypothetical protein
MAEWKVRWFAAFVLTPEKDLFPVGQHRRVPSLRSRRAGRPAGVSFIRHSGLEVLQFTVR